MSTRLKAKEEDVSFIDYKLLKREVARLESVKRKVIDDINLENKKLSDLVGKGIEAKADAEKLISDAKIKAIEINAKAKEKESKITGIESELKGKIAEAEEAKKQADNLIKSNKGKENNLLVSKEIVAGQRAKLTEVLGMIKDVI